jgi:NAD(P)-dependent dehydrogenase (short-subunit alcohol dehydrogenase family)
LGIEWAKRGVRVVGVLAGPLATGQADEERRTLERRSPMHRLGMREEVAEAVLYVASDQASYVVGETLRVDGGWTAYQLF